jgi:Leucine-rich repeat (LRR) protein
MEMNEHHKFTIDLMDLSGNSFITIPTNRLKGIFAQKVLFTGNQIELIESEAFWKCQFTKL